MKWCFITHSLAQVPIPLSHHINLCFSCICVCAWQRFDVNRNGVLSLAEVDKALCESLPQLAANKPAMLRAFKAADRSRNGWLSKQEFVYLLALLHQYNVLGMY